jgi:hypothetical protein
MNPNPASRSDSFRKLPSTPKAAPGSGSFCQGSPLRFDERHIPSPLTAARTVRRELSTKGICFFFQANTTLENEKKRGKRQ